MAKPKRDGTDAQVVEWFKQWRLREGLSFDASLVPSSFDNLADLEDEYWRAEQAVKESRDVPPPPASRSDLASSFVSKDKLERRIDRLCRQIGGWVAGIVKPLEARVAALEATEFKFLGVWTEGLSARPGNAVGHDGSTWIATERTMAKPGTAHSGWMLACKRGRDGRAK